LNAPRADNDISTGPSRRISDAAPFVAALALAGYVLVARVAGNLYPFSTFPMYAQAHASNATRIVAKRASGELREVSEFESWDCPAPLVLDPNQCSTGSPLYTIDYLDREAVEYVREHRGGGGVSVRIVRHIWQFDVGRGPARTSDCELLACRAVIR
jgi:hypothetical protein